MHILYKEDFKDFPLDEFPYDHEHSAVGEYHTVEFEGYKGHFYDPIQLHLWRSMNGSWIISNINGKRYLRQNRGDYTKGHYSDVYSMLVLRDYIYSSYLYEGVIRLLQTNKGAGFLFNYQTSRHYNAILFYEDKIELIYKNQDKVEIINKVEFKADEYKYYNVRMVVDNNFKLYVDDILVLTANIKLNKKHKAGVLSKVSALYTDLKVSFTDDEYDYHIKMIEEYQSKLNLKISKYPKLKLIKKFSIENGGSAKQIRVGKKLNGEPFFILAQHQKLIVRDSFAQISCLTAYDFNGNMMWQIGENNNSYNTTVISCDLPFQIGDFNNDGVDEIVYSQDFKIIVRNAITGELISEHKTPLTDDLMKDRPYKRLNVDAIRFADFEGLGYKGDLIIKDRYENVFALDHNMNILFRYHFKNTGHFPYIYDFNNDNKDEMFVGYSMVDSKGDILFSMPIESDHTDEIIYTSLKNNDEKRLFLASGNEGFNVVNLDGSIYKHNEVGHAQRISIADYNNDLDNEVCVTSFWGANNICYMFDSSLNMVCEKEFMTNGIIITPVAYDGENVLILGNSKEGLLDFELDSVIEFPNDGHPTLCQDAVDIDDDGISEILLWDQKQMYVYKAIEYTKNNKYEMYDECAKSNYRGEFLIKKDC